jgi:hypothetical protein
LAGLLALGAGLLTTAGAGLSAGAVAVSAAPRGLAIAIKNMPVKAPARRGQPSAGAGGVEKEKGSLVKNIPGNGRCVSPGKPGKQGLQLFARKPILGRWRCATQSAAW